MRIISILHGHNSSAVMIDREKFVGAISEERLDRRKNSTAFPREAINELLVLAGCDIKDIDLIVSASKMVPFTDAREIRTYELERENRSDTIVTKVKKLINDVYFYFPITRALIRQLYRYTNTRLMSAQSQLKSERFMRDALPGFQGQVAFADHHLCHAYAVYFGFVPPGQRTESWLIMTLDGEGDGLCATVSIANGHKIERISQTEAGNSIASFYGAVTKHLGMRVNEHEYKVMGLAPYCADSNRDRSYSKLEGLFTINDDLTFSSAGGGNYMSRWLDINMRRERFDSMAAAAQKYVEDLACEWVERSIKKTGINNICLSGGFFMNIKVNKAISEMPSVGRLVVCPSSGDETVPIGGVFVGMENRGMLQEARKYYVKDLYQGPDFSELDIINAAKALDDGSYVYKKCDDADNEVAKLLAEGNVVARVFGRMEFGARALGNRSILGNPSVPDVVKHINDQIKNRDFWMPFACSVLEESRAVYLDEVAGIDYSYMAISCETKELARKTIRGAIHPYDYTARPQIVSERSNPRYHKIIMNFFRLTGIGAILNTSLNLHGEPLVCSPMDALSTFKRSGLQFMLVGEHLFSKKDVNVQ